MGNFSRRNQNLPASRSKNLSTKRSYILNFELTGPSLSILPCQFDQGYMIFDRTPGVEGHFEVYKSERLCSPAELNNLPSRRGHFIPVGRLSSSHPVRAYKFNYPHLCLASWDRFVVTFNVPEMEVESIFPCDGLGGNTRFNYIDFDENYVFLVGRDVWVYERRNGQLIWSLKKWCREGETNKPSGYKYSSNGIGAPDLLPLCILYEYALER